MGAEDIFQEKIFYEAKLSAKTPWAPSKFVLSIRCKLLYEIDPSFSENFNNILSPNEEHFFG
jgi:hypothetical protein